MGNDIAVKKLKPFYVYELVNSLTKKVFYIGKGTGNRAYQHIKEANNTDKSNNKLDEIRSIESSGGKVIIRVIGRYITEKEAFAVESTLIHWVYGRDKLKNDTGGHGCDSIRPFGNLEIIEGIDIPKKIRSDDGTYSKEGIDQREKNAIIPFMEDIKLHIEKNTGYILSEIDTKKPEYTKIFYHLHGVNIATIVKNNSPNKLWVEVQSIDGKNKNTKKIKKLCDNSNLEIKSNGLYAKLPNSKQKYSKQKILISFNNMLEVIKKANK